MIFKKTKIWGLSVLIIVGVLLFLGLFSGLSLAILKKTKSWIHFGISNSNPTPQVLPSSSSHIPYWRFLSRTVRTCFLTMYLLIFSIPQCTQSRFRITAPEIQLTTSLLSQMWAFFVVLFSLWNISHEGCGVRVLGPKLLALCFGFFLSDFL